MSIKTSTDFEPTDLEMGILNGLEMARVKQVETSEVVCDSQRLFDFGLVGRNDKGQLEITTQGRRLLKPA